MLRDDTLHTDCYANRLEPFSICCAGQKSEAGGSLLAKGAISA